MENLHSIGDKVTISLYIFMNVFCPKDNELSKLSLATSKLVDNFTCNHCDLRGVAQNNTTSTNLQRLTSPLLIYSEVLDKKMSSSFDVIRAKALHSGLQLPVEVNQRALIDKILARYASPNAVYRELFQNSNDANATVAEVHFTTAGDQSNTVTEIHYRNNGFAFRDEDWTRLRKIAEGNPAADKVGAFGVGACAMFSICEAPLVISGQRAIAFSWAGDALLVNFLDVPPDNAPWTSFILTPRDPITLPDMVEFGQFLCSSLTFTKSLCQAAVFVDGTRVFSLSKNESRVPRRIPPIPDLSRPAVMNSPHGLFTFLANEGVTERIVEISIDQGRDVATLRAHYYGAILETDVSPDLQARMHRVTKKNPPPRVYIEIFINAAIADGTGDTCAFIDRFSPQVGAGKVFVGFKTSQTTGSGIHLSAPFFPTVEREAVDLQDRSLRLFNSELLSVSGGLMRLALEHSWGRIGYQWEREQSEREDYEQGLKKLQEGTDNGNLESAAELPEGSEGRKKSCPSFSGFAFAKLIPRRARRKAIPVAVSPPAVYDEDLELLDPSDPRPLSQAETDAISLMRSFARFPATPDAEIGTEIGKGFQRCIPSLYSHVLTRTGVVRGVHGKLPCLGIEWFVTQNVVRQSVLRHAELYILHVAGCTQLSVEDLKEHLKVNPLREEELVRLLKWWTKYFYRATCDSVSLTGYQLKQIVTYIPQHQNFASSNRGAVALRNIQHYLDDSGLIPKDVPMPPTVLSFSIRQAIPLHVISDPSLTRWFSPLQFEEWAKNICSHPCLTEGKPEDSDLRIQMLYILSQGHAYFDGQRRSDLEELLKRHLSDKRCLPCEGQSQMLPEVELPRTLYLSISGLEIFRDLGTFKKVSSSLFKMGVTDDFLRALGVRDTVSVEFILDNLANLKWNENPKPLIVFLRSMDLSDHDMRKLKKSKYLPEIRDKSRTYAPFELCLPNPNNSDLTSFPFAKVLQWPSGDSDVLYTRSADAAFLKKLGCAVDPPLEHVIKFLSTSYTGDKTIWYQCLDFLYKRIDSSGPYQTHYRSSFANSRFLPALVEDPLGIDAPYEEMHAPMSCYSNNDCRCLGLPFLIPRLNRRDGPAYASVFQCQSTPSATIFIQQLLNLVKRAKKICSNKMNDCHERVIHSFNQMFQFLSSQVVLGGQMKRKLAQEQFIPHIRETTVEWYRPDQVYFESAREEFPELASNHLIIIEFNSFLASAGVKAQPSIEDLCGVLISSSSKVLEQLGTKKYMDVLRRIAENPPKRQILESMQRTALFLGNESQTNVNESRIERIEHNERVQLYRARLALAKDIYIVDNTQLSRMFNVLTVPLGETIQAFYASCGALSISREVQHQFRVNGERKQDTPLTADLYNRIQQRKKLFMSNPVFRSQINPGAPARLSSDLFKVREADRIRSLYTLRGSSESVDVSCGAVLNRKGKLIIFVTHGFTWNHVGDALSGIIFSQHTVQDSWFIGSVLQGSVDDLKAQGFAIGEELNGTNHESTRHEDNGYTEKVHIEKGSHRVHRFTKPVQFGKGLGKALGLPVLGILSLFMSRGSTRQQGDAQDNLKRKHSDMFGAPYIPDHKPLVDGQPRASAESKRKNTIPEGRWDFVSDEKIVSPAADVENRELLSQELKRAIGSSARVNKNGISSKPRQIVNSIPETFEVCELQRGHEVKLIDGPHGNGRTVNGMLVFGAQKAPESEQFLKENWALVEAFSLLLGRLCRIYSLSLRSVAIFHEPFGRTVAFNSGGALYFNVRYFASLNKGATLVRLETYCLWYCTMAHELAHGFSLQHDQRHGRVMQRFISEYMPAFVREIGFGGETTDEDSKEATVVEV